MHLYLLFIPFVFLIPSLYAACPALPNPYPANPQLPNITELPNPFKFYNGANVVSKDDWPCRRQQLVDLTQHYEYGTYPPHPDSVKGTYSGGDLTVFITVGFTTTAFSVPVTLPRGNGPFPAFIYAGSLPLDFPNHGYATLNINLLNIAADSNAKSGSFWTLYPRSNTGVLLAWAWGYHRVLDVLSAGVVIPQIDGKRVAVAGHSKYGKSALIAAAYDGRVALSVPMSSGTAGVGPFRFIYEDRGPVEKLSNAYNNYPYWYSSNLGQFTSSPGHLPFDQHSLIALVAPRPIIITEGTEDYWTNPEGTSVAFSAARIVYQWLGAANNIGINFRTGTHAPTSADWSAVLEFADWKLLGRYTNRNFNNTVYPAQSYAYPWSAPQ